MTMFRDLEDVVKQELDQELGELAKSKLKSRLKEVRHARRVLAQLEKQYEELLGKDVEEFIGELD